MAQVFSADAQESVADIPMVGTTETVILSTNPLQVPFETAKVKIVAMGTLLMGADQTAINLMIYRNPVVLGQALEGFEISVVPPGQYQTISCACIDQIPSNQAVSYSITVQQTGGTDDGVAYGGFYIEATLLSG